MNGEAIKHRPLGFVRREIAYEAAFGCIPSELFQLSLVVLHNVL
jgi:hypothetical protein